MEQSEKRDIESHWHEVCWQNDISAYAGFLHTYPNCKYAEEAAKRLDTLKSKLLKNLIQFPHHFDRYEMYAYLSNNILSYEDLVTNTGILDDRGYNHIKKIPDIRSEQIDLPLTAILKQTSKVGNVDICNFGVPGSGGKTCLFAAIMTLFNNKDFVLNDCIGAEYARYLSYYMFKNCIPPATDTCYIQVIDTSLKGKNGWHGVSFIEFSGEQAVRIAAADGRKFVSEDVGEELYPLLNNDNRKILLFAIDLSNEKRLCIDCMNDFWIYENDIADCWVSRLAKDMDFCKKIIAIKIIVTKKDLWGISSTQHAINAMIENGYKMFYDRIVNLCHYYGIMDYNNYMPEVIPFSIGKFMPGDTYNFNNQDAVILLDSIRRDLDNYHSNNSVLKKICRIFR